VAPRGFLAPREPGPHERFARHLDAGQRAVIALDFLPELEAEAKARKVLAGEKHGRGQPIGMRPRAQKSTPRRAAEDAAALTGAKLTGVSPRTLARVTAMRTDIQCPVSAR
jgi:hypothetical protein